MRVLHVVRQFSPSIGGFEDVVLNLCRELRAAHGIDARVLTLDRVFAGSGGRLAETEAVEGIPVRRIPYFGSRRYPLAPAVFRHLGDADLLHVHCIDFFFDALAATRWLHRKPMVASTHGGFFHTRFAAPVKQAYFHTVTRLSSRAYARICATSENDRQMFGHIARDRTSLMENGVDVLKWRNAAAPAPVPVLISIGRFSTNKRIPCLFPVLRALREFDPAWRLIVVGREYDQRIAELEDLAEAEMVRDSVKFVAAPTVEECRLLIGAASYFISASAHEGFGLSAVEALSAGLVPVLSPIPPFRELASRAGIGRIVDPERVLETARAIHDLHSTHRTMAEEWRSRAIAAADSYAWPGIAARFAEIYRQAAGTQGARLQMADDIRRAAE